MIKIAIVEDDIYLLESMKEFLELKGYEVVVYNKGVEFVNESEYLDLDLIILDLSLDDRFFHLGQIKENESWIEVMQKLPHSHHAKSNGRNQVVLIE